jgi:16S rRNA (cytosine967-C5)-methyltransferase
LQPVSDARELAADILNDVLLGGRSLTLALAAARARQPGLDARTSAAAQDLTYQVLRHYGRLRFFLDDLAQRPLAPPELAGLLLVGLAELDRADTPDYAAVNEAVRLAGRRFPRARGFVNALLRGFQRQREALARAAALDPVARWNFPLWWIERLRQTYPEHWQDMFAAQNTHPPMTLRVNLRRISPEAYLARLEEAGIAATYLGNAAILLAQPLPVANLPGFQDGLVSVQDLGAQSAARLLEAADGQRVLDACAAPGGKTAHLLEECALDLLALDADAERLRRVRDNLDRLGLDARLLAGDAGRPADWWDGRPFDRILLDAPCTASGVVRRHPDGKWLKRPEDATNLSAQQARLLDAVWPLLRPGGKLLYATCSVFPEENGGQVEAFLRRHADARQESLVLPGGADGQLLPDRDHDGFYYARFVKA